MQRRSTSLATSAATRKRAASQLQAGAPIDVTTHDEHHGGAAGRASGSPSWCSRRTTTVGSTSRSHELAPLPAASPRRTDIDNRLAAHGRVARQLEGWRAAGSALGIKAWTPRGLPRLRRPARQPGGATTTSRHVAVFALRLRVGVGDRPAVCGTGPGAPSSCGNSAGATSTRNCCRGGPAVAHDDLRPGTAPVWRNAPGDLEAWKAGRTGFPFVDAGMRQLRAEGWMHNRVRMVVASFLTRDLRIDWRGRRPRTSWICSSTATSRTTS